MYCTFSFATLLFFAAGFFFCGACLQGALLLHSDSGAEEEKSIGDTSVRLLHLESDSSELLLPPQDCDKLLHDMVQCLQRFLGMRGTQGSKSCETRIQKSTPCPVFPWCVAMCAELHDVLFLFPRSQLSSHTTFVCKF
jgi:hypothetical protein